MRLGRLLALLIRSTEGATCHPSENKPPDPAAAKARSDDEGPPRSISVFRPAAPCAIAAGSIADAKANLERDQADPPHRCERGHRLLVRQAGRQLALGLDDKAERTLDAVLDA